MVRIAKLYVIVLVNGRYCGDDGVLNECQCGLLFNVTSDTFGYRNCYNDTVTDCEYGCHEIKVRCRYETEQCSSNFTDLRKYFFVFLHFSHLCTSKSM